MNEHEYEPLTDEEGNVRELTEADIKRFRPLIEVEPELLEAILTGNFSMPGKPATGQPPAHIPEETQLELMTRIAEVKATRSDAAE